MIKLLPLSLVKKEVPNMENGKLLIMALAGICAGGNAVAEDVVLDLTVPTTVIEYDDQGVWTGVYRSEDVVSQGFVFSHDAPYGDGYYEGFIVSRSDDNSNHTPDWVANQWGCMACGGADEEGNAVPGKPYLINYYSSYSANEYGSSNITRSDAAAFRPLGCYVCNHPWTYYACTVGVPPASPLEDNGYCKITFHGVNTDTQSEETVDFYLASQGAVDVNGDGLLNKDDYFTIDTWQWCDLSRMGEVHVVYVTMESSDTGEWGMNTPAYVCFDRFSADCNSAVSVVKENAGKVFAAGKSLVASLPQAQLVTVYNTAGVQVYASRLGEGYHRIDLSQLPAGVYVVRHDGGAVKVVL